MDTTRNFKKQPPQCTDKIENATINLSCRSLIGIRFPLDNLLTDPKQINNLVKKPRRSLRFGISNSELRFPSDFQAAPFEI